MLFLRVCSGIFTRDMEVNHIPTGKKLKLSQPQQFLAQNRQIVENAYPGDIIGLYDPGIYKIGDTLSQDDFFRFEKLPRFSPEHFAKVTVRNTDKYKQFHKGLSQLSEEGAVQVFKIPRTEEIVLGVVGILQFEVFQHRLKTEYDADVIIDHLSYKIARWLKEPLQEISGFILRDGDGNKVVLFESQFQLNWAEKKYPSITFICHEDLS